MDALASQASELAKPVSASASILTVLEDEKAHFTGHNAAHYHFGLLRAYEIKSIDHTFVLRNDAKTSVTIAQLRPSCGCTSAVPVDAETQKPISVVQPGQVFLVRASVNTESLQPQAIDKTVEVMLVGQTVPAVTLEIEGQLLARSPVSTDLLDFGRVTTHQKRTLQVTVTLPASVVPAGATPLLISTNPDITIVKRKDNSSGKKQATDVRQTKSTLTSLIQLYDVILTPHGHLGTLHDNVSLVFAPNGQKAADTLERSIPVMGEIAGDLVASPTSIAFGTVLQGQSVSKQVIVTGVDIPAATVRVSSPYLQAVFSMLEKPKTAGTSKSSMALLNVTVSAEAPSGALNGLITVTTSSGAQLTLPVFGLISPSK